MDVSALLYALGVALPVLGGAGGSAIGLAVAGSAAAALLGEFPRGRAKLIVMASFPMTQMIYGLVISFSLLMAGAVANPANAFGAGLQYSFVGFVSGAFQGRIAAVAISSYVREQGRNFGLYVALIVFVEVTAIISFVMAMITIM